MDLIAILKDFGFPICACVALAWFLRWTILRYTGSLNARVQALEHAVVAEQARAQHLEADRIKRADAHAKALQDIAEKTARALNRNADIIERNQEVLQRLLDHLTSRPCLADQPEPRPHTLSQRDRQTRVPSSAELPALEPVTDRHMGHG